MEPELPMLEQEPELPMLEQEKSKKRKIDPDSLGIETEGPTEGKTSATKDEVRLWLAGMSREDAIDFIATLAIKTPAVMNEVQERVRHDPSFLKLFVRSLSWDTTDETLLKTFEEYGDIEECVVVKDHITHKSKGFGFVTFASPESVQKALQEPRKLIDGRETSCHLASEKFERQKQKAQNFGSYGVVSTPRVQDYSAYQTAGTTLYQSFVPAAPVVDFSGINTAETKLFVHGLAWETTSQTLRQVFEQYGAIAECAVIHDKQTGKSKGFGFVTYYSPEHAQSALRDSTKMIDGRATYCHLASERSRNGGQKSKFVSVGASIPVHQAQQAQQAQQAALQQLLLQQQLQQLPQFGQQMQQVPQQQFQQTTMMQPTHAQTSGTQGTLGSHIV